MSAQPARNLLLFEGVVNLNSCLNGWVHQRGLCKSAATCCRRRQALLVSDFQIAPVDNGGYHEKC